MPAIAKYGKPVITILPLEYQGKSRDTFLAKWPDPNEKRRLPLLIYATDRISTHNIVHKSEIPKKGEVLTALTIFWLIDVLEKAGVAHHLVAYGKKIYDYLPGKPDDYPKDLHRRAIVVLRLDIIMVEFIFRQYLCGGLWDKFYSKGLENPYGIILPKGLPLMYKFEKALFTPTIKSDTDPELPSEETERQNSEATLLGRKIFEICGAYLHPRGLERLDDKGEFGFDEDGVLRAGDEIMTPDCARFALLSEIKEGQNPRWLDKQIARDKAEAIWKEMGGEREGLTFAPLTVAQLTHANVDLFEMIVGMKLSQFQIERLDN